MDLTPKTLSGGFIDLEPIREKHREGLRAAATAGDTVFAYMPLDIANDYDTWFDDSLARHASGEAIVFIVGRKADGALIGSTSYLTISPPNHRVEIGYTWYTGSAQGTAVNPEAKLLMFSHAFGHLGCIRVELKTDGRNKHSQAAMKKMGAQLEGTWRKHRKVQNGFMRDTVYFSVLEDEWPEVKAGLEARVAKFREAKIQEESE